ISVNQRADGFRRVGFVGVGNQGAPIARRIIDRSGVPTMLWERRQSAAEQFSDTSAAVAADAAELGPAGDLGGFWVWDDDDVEEVLLGHRGVFERMEPGGVVAIHSTVHRDTILRIGAEGLARDIAVVDAPVSGGPHVAAAGEMLVMVGGDRETVDRCR